MNIIRCSSYQYRWNIITTTTYQPLIIRKWLSTVTSTTTTTTSSSTTTTTTSDSGSSPRTTPYSDKHYQPIISEGFAGFDKLIIPKDFQAPNQELTVDPKSIKQQQLQSIVESFKGPIEVSIGYGSGILPQNGYSSTDTSDSDSSSISTTSSTNGTQLDFIHLVKNSQQFHQQNLKQFPEHYSFKSLSLIKLIQGNGIYFNPYVTINNHSIKYGIISLKSAFSDLCEWNSFYFAGRLQKPVNILLDHDIRLKFLNQYNLKTAMTVAIFILDKREFNEFDLYKTITQLSYLGDFRMYIGGENPNKIDNIVVKQYDYFKHLYEPILQYFIKNNYLVIVDNNQENRIFRKNLPNNYKIKLLSGLPLGFRQNLYKHYYEKSIKEIANDDKLGQNMIKVITKIIQISSIKQAIKGIFTAGLIKSLKYALAKQIKFWKGKLNKKG
ncbi:TAM41 [[Candida] subhashii]|uniref:Phosphatidate cytidylyltransferase, mitochondrial n=1 Tax=[Candida] subhashii TaxID=561895 RepID=A0A8J5QF51_9ASCO|nr:TAM41 [[Candida] subhashii]KAG7660939.1 TAM41 [[Candida] subhashii]